MKGKYALVLERVYPGYESAFKRLKALDKKGILANRDPDEWAVNKLAFEAGLQFVRLFLSLMDEYFDGDIGVITIAEIKGIGLLVDELGLSPRRVYDCFLEGLDIKMMSMDGYSYWTEGQREEAARLFRKLGKAVYVDIRQGKGLAISLESHLRREWLYAAE